MKTPWMLAALAGLTAGPALAQPLIAPSRQYSTYSTPRPAGLDKSYGLPTFGMPGSEEPRQRTQAPKPQVAPAPPDPFKGLTTLATPPAQPSETPDFFRGASGPTTAEASDVPDFFQAPADQALPKVRGSQPGVARMETPLYSTDEGSSTGDTTSSDKAKPDDAPQD